MVERAQALEGVAPSLTHGGSFTVINPHSGHSWSHDGRSWLFVGTLELVAVSEACVTGVLHGFGSGDPDPMQGGPELDGSFVAPRC